MSSWISWMKLKYGFHPFHIVDSNPWPIMSSFAIFFFLMSMVMTNSNLSNFGEVSICLIPVLLISYKWWRDIIRESTYQGNHSKMVCWGLYLGFIMFILSEVMFFFSFFFGYFFSALNPDIELGMMWPPLGIQTLSYYQVPLLNTLILLSSGISITWSHHAMICSNKKEANLGFFLTVILSFLFVMIQYTEYMECSFTMCDSVYGSFFYITTGFHGIHVIIGSMFINVSLIRNMVNHFSKNHHVGYEMSIWYWHFVDVVWLFLFLSIYWWGS